LDVAEEMRIVFKLTLCTTWVQLCVCRKAIGSNRAVHFRFDFLQGDDSTTSHAREQDSRHRQ